MKTAIVILCLGYYFESLPLVAGALTMLLIYLHLPKSVFNKSDQ